MASLFEAQPAEEMLGDAGMPRAPQSRIFYRPLTSAALKILNRSKRA
jgi:hypothetical protein